MLSTTQQGIQSQHATIELFNKYKGEDAKSKMLYDWSNNFKTHISLNGGDSQGLKSILEVIKMYDDTEGLEYPYATFYEDESLEGILTSISIIIPEKIYQTIKYLKDDILSTDESGFIFGERYSELSEEDAIQVVENMEKYEHFSEFDIWLLNNLGGYRLS